MDLLKTVISVLGQHVKRDSFVVLGLSGGVDSVVLFNLLCKLQVSLKFKFSCVHVNHQISPHADRWAAFCKKLCERHSVPLQIKKVNVKQYKGLGLEAAARKLRYQIYAKQKADYIILAHHQDDQVETLLLQLLRGAGVKGLSAMPVLKQVSSLQFLVSSSKDDVQRETRNQKLETFYILRPLLTIPRSEIERYAHKYRLKWVDDESNSDIYFQRNFLRHKVLPVLEKQFPAYRDTLSRAAKHFSEASDLLKELAREDLKKLSSEIVPRNKEAVEHSLPLKKLQALGKVRTKNVLRYWFDSLGIPVMQAAQFEETVDQLFTASHDAQVCITHQDWCLRRFQDRLFLSYKPLRLENSRGGYATLNNESSVAPCLFPSPALRAPSPRGRGKNREVARRDFHNKNFLYEWHGESQMVLKELNGILRFEQTIGQGIDLASLKLGKVTIRLRQGGERFQPDCKRPRRSLKNLFQEYAIPPWERQTLPLLFSGEELVYVPGIGIDCKFQARKKGMVVTWDGNFYKRDLS